jgi:hypothetical protein
MAQRPAKVGLAQLGHSRETADRRFCVVLLDSNPHHGRCERLAAKLRRIDWQEFTEIDARIVAQITEANSFLVLDDIQAHRLWTVLRGFQGLGIMQKNVEVFIELTSCAQPHYPDHIVVTGELRSDAEKLKWFISRLRAAARTNKLCVSVPFYAPSAVWLYCRMVRRVHEFYGGSSPLIPHLLLQVGSN